MIGKIISLILLATIHGFILDQILTDCPAARPCLCYIHTINCDERGLKRIPRFHKTRKAYHYLSLSGNQITQIGPAAFANLTTEGSLTIMLHDNPLVNVDTNAFEGLEGTSLSIDFTGTKLSTLPPAIQNLRRLYELKVDSLKSLDDSVMVAPSASLTTLSLGFKYLTTWPQEIRSLKYLRSLYLNGFSGDFNIPDTAFDDLGRYLTELHLDLTHYKGSVPSLCKLYHLRTLSVTSLEFSTSRFFTPTCSTPMTSVEVFVNDNVTSIPTDTLLNKFPNLKTLQLSGCGLDTLTLGSIPTSNKMAVLDLSNNKLTRVPGVIASLKHVEILDLSYNRITTISSGIFANSQEITTLKLKGNPISSVDNQAFSSLTNLRRVDLRDAKLKSFSISEVLPQLVEVKLENNPIVCDCGLSWVQPQHDTTHLYIFGLCIKPQLTIQQYVLTKLSDCHHG